ncbi:MAG: alpha/beta fold hydrolase [Acidobacteriota bacterium]|nr:alpha/beta fold hydrolase [Acidobacteriota bacterium]
MRNRLIAYAGLAIVITVFFRWFGQYVLYPAPSRPVVPSPPPEPLIEVSIQGASGRISAWLMEPAGADETTPLMVFFHGNGENLQLLYQTGFFHQVVGMGTGILAVDYPGYGNSEGQPDEEALQDCGKATLTWARQQYPNRPLIIAGWSLGAAVAIRNAADSGIDYQGLVLISPWSSLGDVARHHFPNWMVRAFLVETYDSMEAAPRISTPTLAIHGTEDEIIPEPLGRRLAQAIPDCHYEPVPLFGHNDIISAPMFWSALKTYFQEVVP